MKLLDVCTFVFILHQNNQKLLKSCIKNRKRPIHPGMMNSLSSGVLRGMWETPLCVLLWMQRENRVLGTLSALDTVLSPPGLTPHVMLGQRLGLISEVFSKLSDSVILCYNTDDSGTGIVDQKLFPRRNLVKRNDPGKVFISINRAFSVDTQDPGF